MVVHIVEADIVDNGSPWNRHPKPSSGAIGVEVVNRVLVAPETRSQLDRFGSHYEQPLAGNVDVRFDHRGVVRPPRPDGRQFLKRWTGSGDVERAVILIQALHSYPAVRRVVVIVSGSRVIRGHVMPFDKIIGPGVQTGAEVIVVNLEPSVDDRVRRRPRRGIREEARRGIDLGARTQIVPRPIEAG